jgi:arylsulfatase A-like enzyme
MKPQLNRKTMKLILTLVAALLLAPLHAADSRPNIVFLFTDDQTIGAMGCYGNKEIITPHMDKLAADGVRFQNHYNTTSICMASRASVMTGLYEYRHGCNFSHGDLQRRLFDQSYPVKLRQAGYFTGVAGKIGFLIEGEKFEAFEKEFDVWSGGPGQTHYETVKNEGIAKYADKYPHCSRAYGAWAKDFMTSAKQSGKPFCMSISFKAPHLPFTPDPMDLKLYESKQTFLRPLNYGVENGKHLSPQARSSRAATDYREWVNDYDNHVRLYYALISGVDAAVGMIREELNRQGLAQNTVIILTSDNGYNSGSHGFGDKVLPYEESSKSPLIIFDPRLPKSHAGQVSNSVTANVDMTATIFALANVAAPSDIDGKNLIPLLSNPTNKVRDWLPLFNHWGAASAQSMAVVSSEWKYVHWYYAGQWKPEDTAVKSTEELFHLKTDRTEMTNVAADAQFASQLAAARAAYDAELSAMKTKVIAGHGYEAYPILFDRTTAWLSKESLVKEIIGNGASEGGNGEARGNRANADKSNETRKVKQE